MVTSLVLFNEPGQVLLDGYVFRELLSVSSFESVVLGLGNHNATDSQYKKIYTT